jgi:hypothetical protein
MRCNKLVATAWLLTSMFMGLTACDESSYMTEEEKERMIEEKQKARMMEMVVSRMAATGYIEEVRITEVRFKLLIPNFTPFSIISAATIKVTAGPEDNTVIARAPLTIQDNIAVGKVLVLAGKKRVFTLEVKEEKNGEKSK